jgi:hypothetical protein
MSTTTATSPAAPHRFAEPRAQRISLGTVTAAELRKTIDTRAGRWLLAVIAVLAAAALVYRLVTADRGEVSYAVQLGTALGTVNQLLPVLGVLAMTTEWTQRTALTTFTTVPQRGMVIAAKLAATTILTLAIVLLVAGSAAATTWGAGLIAGEGPTWGQTSTLLAGAAATSVLGMLIGAAFGALLQVTPLAVVAYFVVPTLASTVAPELLGDDARWVDIYLALTRVSELDLGDAVAPTLVTLTVWIAVPMAVGVIRSLRREVH